MRALITLWLLCTSAAFPSIGRAEQVTFEVPISAVYFPASSDIDGDGVDDVVISAQIDPYAQLGIKCCEVPAEKVDSLVGIVPQVYLSNYGRPKFIRFPPEAETHRAWAGEFFEIEGKKYYLHGRNGELGLPSQNKGERSQIYRVENIRGEISFVLSREFPSLTTTASVDVSAVNGGVEIIENNYNAFSSQAPVYRSHIFHFSELEELIKVTPKFSLREDVAHNEIKYSSFFSNHIIASAEVWKNYSGTQTQSRNPASYYAARGKKIDLLPTSYGMNHAGISAEELLIGEKVYIVELSSEFFGHQNGGFKGSSLRVYESIMDNPQPSECTGQCKNVKINLPQANLVSLNRIDLNFDGEEEIYLSGYRRDEVSIFYGSAGEFSQIDSRRFELQDPGGWYGRVRLLRDNNRRCVFSISVTANFSTGLTRVPIKISACRERRI